MRSSKPERESAQAPEERAFAIQAAGPQQGFLRELLGFLMNNKKWWLGPIVLVLLLVSFLVVLAGTSIAPFIYTLF